jgi:hypothetical protein
MDRMKAKVKRLLMEETSDKMEELERGQAVHKQVAAISLRTRGVFPDKKGYDSIVLLLKATHAIRELDLGRAETHVREWKQCAQDRMDEQLFGQSAHCIVNARTGDKVRGTDESTRQLGEWVKDWSEWLDKWVEAVCILSM